MKPVVSTHARYELGRRGIDPELLDNLLVDPEQIVKAYGGRKAYQLKFEEGGRTYLLRAIVSAGEPPTVITVYRTSRIDKYWRSK